MNRELLKQRMYEEEPDTTHSGFESYVQELLDHDRLADLGVPEGIGKQIASQGVKSLSDKQVYVFVEQGLIGSDNYVEVCERCYNSIPWSEMIDAIEDNYCGYCRHMLEKDD